MDKRKYTTLLLLAASLLMKASVEDSAVVEHTDFWQEMSRDSRQNPALHGVAFSSSFSQLDVEADWQRQSEAFVLEKGHGFLLPSACVDTYLRLSDHTAVWGHASYMNGRQHGVSWNSTSDFDLLKPYVLADTLGGDTQRERYRFEGGYATQLSRWILGAEMLFRADHEYRDIDPRMRGVVNDLTLRVGAGYEKWNYRWAMAVEGNIYKQQNSVDFYRELGVIPEYQMTGLGTEYARFSGDKRSLHYDGGGVSLLFDAEPTRKSGFFGHLELGKRHFRRLVTENYTLPLTELYAQGVKGKLGVRSKEMGRKLAVFADFDYTKRSGDEHIVGTSATSSFPDLGLLTMYKNHRLNTSLTVLYGKAFWHIRVRAGYKSDRERYAYPERRLETTHTFGEVSGEAFLKPSERWLLTCRLKSSYSACVSDDLAMPFADMRPAFVAMIRHNYDFAKAHYTDVSAQVRGDFALKNYGLFAELGGGFVHCSVGERQISARVALGITF